MTMKARRVLVTGTTSGVGLALLELYSQRGAHVVAVNRRRVPELESRYPAVRFECVDVRSLAQVEALIRRLAQAAELPDVFVLNAGINQIDNDESFEVSSYRAVLDTNLYGVLNFVQPLTALAARKAPLHLVAVSSMVNYVGNPYALGYTTSKRALSVCFDTWSRMYTGTDLVFQQVMLGPVHTAIYTMERRLPPWMGWLKRRFSASPSKAARAIARFAASRRKTLFFPWQAVPLFLGMVLCQLVLPSFFRGRSTLAGDARRGRAPSLVEVLAPDDEPR